MLDDAWFLILTLPSHLVDGLSKKRLIVHFFFPEFDELILLSGFMVAGWNFLVLALGSVGLVKSILSVVENIPIFSRYLCS